MTEAILFLVGFTCVTSVYEIAKTGKTTKSDKARGSKDYYKRVLK